MRRYSPPPLPKIEEEKIPFLTFSSEQVIDRSSFVQKTFVPTIVDVDSVHEGLTPSDFLLDVLIANGATNLLQVSKPIQPSQMDLSDQFNNLENSLSHV